MASRSTQEILESLDEQLALGKISESTYDRLRKKYESRSSEECSPGVPSPGKKVEAESNRGVPSPGKKVEAESSRGVPSPGENERNPDAENRSGGSKSYDPFGVTSTELPLVPGMEIGDDLADDAGKRYLVGNFINKGAWGAVYKGEDRKFKRPVAIKAIFTTATADKVTLKRLEREARLGAAVTHPNVVHIYDFDVYMGVYFLVMELVDGGDLNSLRAVREDERFPLDDAIPLLYDMAEGLDYLHSKGIIHRDLKPSNLLWHPSEKKLKITDFGLSNTARESMILSGAKMPSISGTDPYMAPEIWDAADPSEAGDLYALGIIAYEMLKGNLPFRGPNFAEQHRTATIHAIQGLPSTVQEALEMVLAKQPSARCSCAKEFITLLEKPPYPTCPECGKAEDMERFTCPECGKEEICVSHRSKADLCPKCEKKRVADEEIKKEAEEKRLLELAKQKRIEEERKRANEERKRKPKTNQALLSATKIVEVFEANRKKAEQKRSAAKKRKEEERKRAEQERIVAEKKRKEEEERKRRTTPGFITDGPLTGMKFAYIPAGSFLMGFAGKNEMLRDKCPQHEVYLDAFEMMTTQVTNHMVKKMLGKSFIPDDQYPISVSWDDTQKFLEELNREFGRSIYRLPTEAEWEYACRAGTTTAYWSGDNKSDLDKVGWYKENSGGKIQPVGTKPANPWNLYDMHGNEDEWCSDFYADYKIGSDAITSNPQGPNSGFYHVTRSGSYLSGFTMCYSFCRYKGISHAGFRIVRSID